MFFRNTFLAGIANALGIAALGRMLGPPLPTQSFRKSAGSRSRSRTYGHPQNNTGWWRRNADLSPLLITERMLMRHGWYRRQLRKHGIAIDPGAKNAMVLR